MTVFYIMQTTEDNARVILGGILAVEVVDGVLVFIHYDKTGDEVARFAVTNRFDLDLLKGKVLEAKA